MTRGRIRSVLLVSTACAGMTFITSASQAQVAQPIEAVQPRAAGEEQEEELVVTGTRIVRPDLELSSPVSVITRDEIDLRQANNAEELLRDLPAVRPANGPTTNVGADGRAEVDLRGLNLDSNRTLVLMDGRRLVPADLGAITDTDVIPLALMNRVDVVTGGASTVYGADAVAGVVNFITRRDFSGVEASASYRIAEEGDAAQRRADVTWGANVDGGRGNVVLSFGYQNRDELQMSSRKVSRIRLDSATGLFQGSSFTAPAILVSPSIPGAPNIGFGGAVIDPATGTFRSAVQSDQFNLNEGVAFVTPMERYNIYGAARYEITPSIEFYGTAIYNSKSFGQRLTPPASGSPLRLGLNNPFLPVPARNQLCASADSDPATPGLQPFSAQACAAAAAVQGGPGTPGYVEIPIIINRRFVEEGPRVLERDIDLFQAQAGLRGQITDTLTYDISAQYGKAKQVARNVNFGLTNAVQQAVRAFRNSAGNIVCADPSNGCVPLNLFGGPGTVTPEMLTLFDVGGTVRRNVSQTVITGSVSGDLFGIRSPFAEQPAAFAVGGEYRSLSGQVFPDAPSQRGELLAAGPTSPEGGKLSVKEVFAELIIPLVQNSFIHSATIEAGIRHSDYSTTGGSTTWKAGGSLEPIEGIKFRGMYQRAVRSPNLFELFGSRFIASNNLQIDPCAGANPTAARNLCEATGAPPGRYGSIPQPSAGLVNVTFGGNPDLEPETARTITLGAVFTPSFIPRFSATIDYFDILLTDAVGGAAAGDILDGCYSTALNPSQTPDNMFCPLIQRNPVTGSLNGGLETPGVSLVNTNLGRVATSGVDFGIAYRMDLADLGFGGDAGSLSLGLNGTWLEKFHHQFTTFTVNRDCTGVYSPRCTNPRPTWKWNARATYTVGSADISLMWSHMSPVIIEPFQAQPTLPLATPQFGGPNPAFLLDKYESIEAYDYFDLSFRYRALDKLTLTLTIDNLLDKKPPSLGEGVGAARANVGNTFPGVFDVLGRSYTFGARLTF